MATVGADIPDAAKKAVENIAWANGPAYNPSVLVRKALHHYITENPDGLVVPVDDRDTWEVSMVGHKD